MPRVIFREGKPDVRIITYPDALRTSWHDVREVIPKLWDGNKKLMRMYIDPDKPKTFPVHAILHIGMLDQPDEAYRFERNSFKSGYELPDVDGKRPDEADKNGGGTWDGLPEMLTTDLPLDKIYNRVKSQLKVCFESTATAMAGLFLTMFTKRMPKWSCRKIQIDISALTITTPRLQNCTTGRRKRGWCLCTYPSNTRAAISIKGFKWLQNW
jgi:hypothetical protein